MPEPSTPHATTMQELACTGPQHTLEEWRGSRAVVMADDKRLGRPSPYARNIDGRRGQSSGISDLESGGGTRRSVTESQAATGGFLTAYLAASVSSLAIGGLFLVSPRRRCLFAFTAVVLLRKLPGSRPQSQAAVQRHAQRIAHRYEAAVSAWARATPSIKEQLCVEVTSCVLTLSVEYTDARDGRRERVQVPLEVVVNEGADPLPSISKVTYTEVYLSTGSTTLLQAVDDARAAKVCRSCQMQSVNMRVWGAC